MKLAEKSENIRYAIQGFKCGDVFRGSAGMYSKEGKKRLKNT